MAEVMGKEPVTTAADLDEDVASLNLSLDQFYRAGAEAAVEGPQALQGLQGLEEMLATVFAETEPGGVRLAASDLIRLVERALPGSVYQWTGHLPERTRALLDNLAQRADAMSLTYRVDQEQALTIALTSLVTSLAMTWVTTGKYVP
jgi:hypothetical protein